MASGNSVDIASGNGLLPDSNIPLPGPMLAYGKLEPKEQTSVKYKYI